MSGTETAAVVAVACLPDDIIRNILDRVPDPVSLFRCSLVCKEWRGIVGDPTFQRRRGMASSSLLGIFVQRDRPRKISEQFPTIAPALVAAPGSVLGPQLRFLTSFVRDDAGILDDAQPLTAHDGLLLLRVWRPRSTDKNLMRLCVCNLLTGKRDLLPALDVDAAFNANEGVQGYALLTAADHGPDHRRCPADGYSTLFQVLLVGRRNSKQPLICRDDAEQLQIRRFSSASGDWDALDCSKAILGFPEPNELWDDGLAYCVATVAGGTAHWLFCSFAWRSFYTLDVRASTGQVLVNALPADTAAAMTRAQHWWKPWWLWTTAEGRLSLLHASSNNWLVMMRQRDDGDHQWDSSHVAEVHVAAELGLGYESLSPVCIGERSGTALALYSTVPELAYVLDLKSSAASATKVEGWIQNFNTKTVAPFEINWAMFFVSRLGVKLI